MSDFLTLGTRTLPGNYGPLKGANGNARILGPCGDTMEFWVYIEDGVIHEATYTTDGCYHSVKCGMTAAAMAQGTSIEVAEKFTQADVLAVAGDIADESSHCGLLAANTLKAAIADWKKRNHATLRSGQKKQSSARSIIQPRPNLLVSCRGKDGKDNALVVVYAGNCSLDPPMVMVGIVPTRHSYDLVRETSCFVVNLVTPAQKEMYDYIGSHSGRNCDKLATIGAKTANGTKVNAPILTECPVNIECTVVDSIRTGSHEMFIGKIEYVHADEEIVKEDGAVDWDRLMLL
jgi:flavin reductase (DIM6/NTAB) family NADH-FMN oxidoreductase RutF/NifU-like protein involved in Fe-S cluster formation